MTPLKEYTLHQLALRNGRDREEVWIAVEGLIYDVTESRLWREGQHYEHWAGQEMDEELEEAPHTRRVLEKFKVVGSVRGKS